MVGNVTIQGQIVGTATFDGAKISAVVTIAPPINATVNFGGGISTIEQLPDPVSDSSNIYRWIRSALLTGLSAFTDVTIAATDTILAAFAKLQGQINALATRIGVLEDNVLVDITITKNVFSVDITTDKYGNALSFENGDVVQLEIIGGYNRGNGSFYVALNNKISAVYHYTSSIPGFYSVGHDRFVSRYEILFNSKNCHSFNQGWRSAGDYSNITQFTVNCISDDYAIEMPVTQFNIYGGLASDRFLAGTKIIIKKK